MCRFTMSFSADTASCSEKSKVCDFITVTVFPLWYITITKKKEDEVMRVGINDALKKYLEDKGYRHLVLQIKLCRS